MATVCQNDHSKYVFHGRLRSEIRLFHTEQRGPNFPCSIATAECLSLYVLTGYQGAKNERGDGRVVWSLQPNGSVRQLLQWNILGCHFFGLIVGFPLLLMRKARCTSHKETVCVKPALRYELLFTPHQMCMSLLLTSCCYLLKWNILVPRSTTLWLMIMCWWLTTWVTATVRPSGNRWLSWMH